MAAAPERSDRAPLGLPGPARGTTLTVCLAWTPAHIALPRESAVYELARQQGKESRCGIAPDSEGWATPLEVLLAAERAALLSGRDDEFAMLVTIGYTRIRWGETIGLERDLLLPTLINVEWQLREIRGRFFRLPPKDDSYRSTNWEPLVPVDLPAFLAELLTAQADKRARQRCGCDREHGGTGRYVFYSQGGHYRRSNFARRVFRPACDGRYEPAGGRPGRLVVVDATAWRAARPRHGRPRCPGSG